MWVKMSDRELADASSAIIKGRLIGASEVTLAPNSRRLRLGVILVERTYKGTGQDVIYLELPSSQQPKSSIDMDYPKGTYGIWFLRNSTVGKGILKADNPQRFWPMDNSADRINTLFPNIVSPGK